MADENNQMQSEEEINELLQVRRDKLDELKEKARTL